LTTPPNPDASAPNPPRAAGNVPEVSEDASVVASDLVAPAWRYCSTPAKFQKSPFAGLVGALPLERLKDGEAVVEAVNAVPIGNIRSDGRLSVQVPVEVIVQVPVAWIFCPV